MEALVKDLGQRFDTGLIEKEKRTYAEMIQQEERKKQQLLEMYNLPKRVRVPVKDSEMEPQNLNTN